MPGRTVRPTPYTLHATPYTIHPADHTLHPKPSPVPLSGLVGVVINGLPNQMGGSQLLHAPRAVLWGQHTFGPASLTGSARVCMLWLAPALQAAVMKIMDACCQHYC